MMVAAVAMVVAGAAGAEVGVASWASFEVAPVVVSSMVQVRLTPEAEQVLRVEMMTQLEGIRLVHTFTQLCIVPGRQSCVAQWALEASRWPT